MQQAQPRMDRLANCTEHSFGVVFPFVEARGGVVDDVKAFKIGLTMRGLSISECDLGDGPNQLLHFDHTC